MEISGKVKKIFDSQTKGNFTFREIVLTTYEQYPQDIVIQFTQDKIELLSLYQPGDELKIWINIRGRQWKSPQGEIKYFNTISGWRIERLNQNSSNYEMIQNTDLNLENEENDLPF